MIRLLLLLLCVPLIGFGQSIPTIYAESINKIYDRGDLIHGHFIDYVLVFEIVEVYKGDKWSDVAISGIGTSDNCCTETR